MDDRVISFTSRKPPKISTPVGTSSVVMYDEELSWQLFNKIMDDDEVIWQLVCDPTAAAAGGGGGVLSGSGLAGADGLLGRCLTVKLHLQANSLKGRALLGVPTR
jgi:hypothetical protein